MNEVVKHKWLMLDKDVASVLMTVDAEYWKTYLRRDGKILVKLVEQDSYEGVPGQRLPPDEEGSVRHGQDGGRQGVILRHHRR